MIYVTIHKVDVIDFSFFTLKSGDPLSPRLSLKRRSILCM